MDGTKEDSSINVSNNSNNINIGRLVYDNLFNIIVMIIMMNIVQGIIIDTFAILRN